MENVNNEAGKGSITEGFFALTRKIAERFKISPDAKVQSFLKGLEKDMKRTIQTITHNIGSAEIKHEQSLEELNDSIEDAIEGVSDAWLNVDPERVSSKAQQKAYQDEYVAGIEAAEAKVDSLNKRKENLVAEHEAYVEAEEAQIAELNRRIEKLNQL